ncbi:hypothetical protein JF544_01510 [Halobacillus kuroshimensis]|uniref:Uncharacterized protein n=1 Tax=Halobacillus kuroshimensis TaxID=302481 RepID=A0ABS3DRD2_9BACI|nr:MULTISPECIES: hypothetical protein [Halobacillus]MBN8233898.1 hypothetical protein [Halobacillus kuroshimensis]
MKNKTHDHTELAQKLAEYDVDVPDIPRQKSRWSRLVHYLASPADNPVGFLAPARPSFSMTSVIPVLAAAAVPVAALLF